MKYGSMVKDAKKEKETMRQEKQEREHTRATDRKAKKAPAKSKKGC